MQFWAPQFKKDVELSACIQRRGTQLEGLSWGCLGTLGGSGLEKRRLEGSPHCSVQIPERGNWRGMVELFSLVFSDRTHGNGPKPCQGMFRLGIRKHFCSETLVKHWNRFPGEHKVFRRHLHNALNNMFWLLVSPEVVRQWD